ncbi:probable GTP-binding protein OBGC2 [Selaginella moellendorffii]|uniref:probable GTP-binding protein OBGC2 n=1 Tax=Selaginella moellendorffii TaxID=88036 RepID=UPI000D1CDA32|nr:probable GTP-binding protein OBGC2 [Selaginella moellendorffii]|eukprot:XP_024530147.1 probable GTP-binding protein OBGC2 [Selaginella moellendorffii]
MASLGLPSSSSFTVGSSRSLPGRRVLIEFGGAWTRQGVGLRLRSKGSFVVYSVAATKEVVPANLEKEPHKYFDQVTIIVRSGDGGDGAILSMPKPPADKEEAKKRKKLNWGPLRKAPDGSILLPMGGHGGDVVIAADETADSLLEFHKKKRYNARRGSDVGAVKILTPRLRDAGAAPTLKLYVPVGTVVKQKTGSKLLADLTKPGDKILVARGGRGGMSMLNNPVSRKVPQKLIAPIVTDPRDKTLIKGVPGEELVLELTLRVVADIGLVGLPNAGKSSLLAAVSQARPDIAAYPFTTLMPNLGRLQGDPETPDGGLCGGATMADLPGLIKDAHLGKGLGRMFLRHLRRTRLILHVVDASADNPVEDYKVLCEELRMYNPEYLDRPHIVVLNKLDLIQEKGRVEAIKQRILEVPDVPSMQDDDQTARSYPRAAAVVGISALKREGISNVLKQVRRILKILEQAEEGDQA